MRVAWETAFVAVSVFLIRGIMAAIRGERFAAALFIFILAPVGYGQHVALGMAISYAEREK